MSRSSQAGLAAFSLTPREIVSELDRFIVGQKDAKRAVAVALRNRWRRKMVEDEMMREEIMPKNILMIGPTGVGKTEIARRLAKLVNAPFLKVEATQFTEVGYVGREVGSIIRDLLDIGVVMVREARRKEVAGKAQSKAEERILDALVGEQASQETREKFRTMLDEGSLNEREIEIMVSDSGGHGGSSMMDIPGVPGGQMGILNIGDMIGRALGGDRLKGKHMTVEEAMKVVLDEESDKLIDNDKIIKDSIEFVENDGIVFIDEIDKVVARHDVRGGEVSREGVQRDLLPLLEGTSISTKYGVVNTQHILFIASGAFHMSKPSDLLPELQGRLPIRVELSPLGHEDMVRILKEPEANLPKQYMALMGVEEVTLEFTNDAIDKIAEIAININRDVENIGARRLHTLLEKLLETISFDAPDKARTTFTVSGEYVNQQLGTLTKQHDLARFIL